MKVSVSITHLIRQGCLLLGVLALAAGDVYTQVDHQQYLPDQWVEPFDLYFKDARYTVRTRASKDDFLDVLFTPGSSPKAAPTPLIFSGFSPFQAVRQRNDLTLTYYSDWSSSIKLVLYEEDIRKVWHFNKSVISTPGAAQALVKLTSAIALENGDYLLAGILQESIQGAPQHGIVITKVSSSGKLVWQTRKKVPFAPVRLKLLQQKTGVHYFYWEYEQPLASSAMAWVYPNGSWSARVLDLPIPCGVSVAVNDFHQMLITGHNACDSLGATIPWKAVCIDTLGKTLWARTGWESLDKSFGTENQAYVPLSALPVKEGWMIFGKASKLHSYGKKLPYVFAADLDIYGDLRRSNAIPVSGVNQLIAAPLPQQEWLLAYAYPTDSLHQELGFIHWNQYLEVREKEHPLEKSMEYLTRDLPVVINPLDGNDHLNGEYLLKDGPTGIWFKVPMHEAQPALIPSFTCLPRPDNPSQLTCMVQLCATNDYSIAQPTISLQTLPGWKFIKKNKELPTGLPLKYLLPNIKKTECLTLIIGLEQISNQSSSQNETEKKVISKSEKLGDKTSSEIIIIDDAVWKPINTKDQIQTFLVENELSESSIDNKVYVNDRTLNAQASSTNKQGLKVNNHIEFGKTENIIIIDDAVWKPGNSNTKLLETNKKENIIIIDDAVWKEQYQSTDQQIKKPKTDNIIIIDDAVWRTESTPNAPLDQSKNTSKANQYHSYSTNAGSMIRLLAEQPYTGAIQVFDSQGQSLGQLNCHRNYLYVPPDLATGTYIMRTGTGYVFRLILK